jgi:hypothetical protein
MTSFRIGESLLALLVEVLYYFKAGPAAAVLGRRSTMEEYRPTALMRDYGACQQVRPSRKASRNGRGPVSTVGMPILIVADRTESSRFQPEVGVGVEYSDARQQRLCKRG